ncbi:MAG: hypothetical protein QF803_09090 [Gammaproteobacteria bacterium]|nr:hypothetical protein [Gammaproteobacteria bacterium]MDP6695756.1 hypothetical protein [Gammaproteobacteria bacterium]
MFAGQNNSVVLLFTFLAALLVACEPEPTDPYAMVGLPAADEYCLAAQTVVTKTLVPMQLVVQEDFNAFVKSKAVIDGPTIQQYNWYNAAGNILGISCKLKSADHLNLEFGEGSAGPDGLCQDMNRQVYGLLLREISNPVYDSVIFDVSETVSDDGEPIVMGPQWLAPFRMTYLDDESNLHVATKGFVTDFTDERFLKMPARFRGVHYCHLVAPEYFAGLLNGTAEAGASVGRAVNLRGRPNPALSR